jgi:hypothetical protein
LTVAPTTGRVKPVRRAALVAVLLAACAATPASAREDMRTEAEAATFCLGTGAQWRRGTTRGTTYVITVSRGVTCAFAKPWVRRLTARPARRSGQALSGPPGYQCRVTIPFGGKAAGGACGRSGGRGFGWVPKF